MAIQTLADDASDAALDAAWETLHETRPTAINLRWALDEMRDALTRAAGRRAQRARPMPVRPRMADEDVELNRAIGRNGLAVIRDIAARQEARANQSTS